MRVHVIATGGTIASTAGGDGAAPALSGADLVDAVPELEEYADVTVESVSQTPGFDMDPDTVAAVGRRVRAVADDVAGVVVTHGTDTMEESAYYLDLAADWDVPVVFTGAQRRPDETSADGPANLLTAVRAAAHDRLDSGVALAFDDELHAARDVTKAHTAALGTFTSPDTGPVARFARSTVHWYRDLPRTSSVDTLETDATVPVVSSGTGMGSGQLERAVAAGVDGVVVAATGLGNVTAALGDAVAEAVEEVPVVVASRCFAGATDPVYGTPGGAVTLADHGARFADDLPPSKARVALALALAANRVDEFEALVARP